MLDRVNVHAVGPDILHALAPDPFFLGGVLNGDVGVHLFELGLHVVGANGFAERNVQGDDEVICPDFNPSPGIGDLQLIQEHGQGFAQAGK